VQALFYAGPLEPWHALTIAVWLGILPHDVPERDLGWLAGNREGLLAASRVPDGDGTEQVEQVRGFLRSLRMAAATGKTVIVEG
jgi:hypothetical protein